jgi:hypothetical protein
MLFSILKNNFFSLRALGAIFIAAGLSACGGGSESGAANAPLVLTGVAATGLAISGGSVSARCVSGTPVVAATSVSGAFSLNVANATLPCMLELSYSDSMGMPQKLHSYASSAGVVNITPLTELVVAAALRGSPLTNFTSSTLNFSSVTSNISSAINTVKARLTSLGVSTANFPQDPITTPFVAASASTAGDAVDRVLDDLKAKIASTNTPLATLVLQVASGQTSNTGGTTTTVPSTNSETIIFTPGQSVNTSQCSSTFTSGNPVNLSAGETGHKKCTGAAIPDFVASSTGFSYSGGGVRSATQACTFSKTGNVFTASLGTQTLTATMSGANDLDLLVSIFGTVFRDYTFYTGADRADLIAAQQLVKSTNATAAALGTTEPFATTQLKKLQAFDQGLSFERLVSGNKIIFLITLGDISNGNINCSVSVNPSR